MAIHGGRTIAGRTERSSPFRRRALWLLAVMALVVAGAAAAAVGGLGASSTARTSSPRRCPGRTLTGAFYSRARHREVGYTLGYPPVCRRRNLPLVIFLHGYGGSHRTSFGGFSMQAAAAYRPPGRRLVPMAWVAADGGNNYWHAHPGDNPMRMLVRELIPLCHGLGLGRGPKNVAVAGNSMGGYGALLLAELHPKLIRAVALLSPAFWPTYRDELIADPLSRNWTSQADFTRYDVARLAGRLRNIPIVMASGTSDEFHVYVQGWLYPALTAVTSVKADLDSPGGHDGTFFAAKAPAQIAFLQSKLGR